MYRDWNTEKQARPEILSQNQNDLQKQVARIKETFKKVPDKEIICTLLCEQGITKKLILTVLSTTIALVIRGIHRRRVGLAAFGSSLPEKEGNLEKYGYIR